MWIASLSNQAFNLFPMDLRACWPLGASCRPAGKRQRVVASCYLSVAPRRERPQLTSPLLNLDLGQLSTHHTRRRRDLHLPRWDGADLLDVERSGQAQRALRAQHVTHLVGSSQQGCNQHQLPAVTRLQPRTGRPCCEPCSTRSLSAIESGRRRPPYDPFLTRAVLERHTVQGHTELRG